MRNSKFSHEMPNLISSDVKQSAKQRNVPRTMNFLNNDSCFVQHPNVFVFVKQIHGNS